MCCVYIILGPEQAALGKKEIGEWRRKVAEREIEMKKKFEKQMNLKEEEYRKRINVCFIIFYFIILLFLLSF